MGQNVSGQVFWPNGGLVEIPLTLHVKYDGCPQTSFDHEFNGGAYSFHIFLNPLLGCETIELSLSGIANARDFVSTLDLVRIMKHLLGTSPFTNALQYIAADANNSYSASALDLVEIRNVILGVYQDWPNNNTLNFFHKTTPSAPALGAPLTSEVSIPLNGASHIIDFWAVKTGDINH